MELAAAVRVTRTISLAGGAHANHYNAKLAEMTRAERASALVDKFVDADDSTKSRFALAAGQGCALHHPMPCVWKSQHSTLGVETESHLVDRRWSCVQHDRDGARDGWSGSGRGGFVRALERIACGEKQATGFTRRFTRHQRRSR